THGRRVIHGELHLQPRPRKPHAAAARSIARVRQLQSAPIPSSPQPQVPSRLQHGDSSSELQSGQLLALHVDVEPPVPVLVLPPLPVLPPRLVRPPVPLPVPPAPVSDSQPVPAALRRNPERQSKSHMEPVHFVKPLAGAAPHGVHGPAGSQPMAGAGERHCESHSFCCAGHADPSGASPASALLPDDDRVPPAPVAPPDRPARAPLPASWDDTPWPPLPLSPLPPEEDVALTPPLLVV